MKVVLIAISIVLFGLVSGCDKATRTDTINTVITGQVTDLATGLPVDSAMIQLRDTVYGIIDYSDSTGRYMTGDLGYGSWRLFCRKSGYETTWIDVISTSDRTRVEGADFHLSQ